MYTSFASSFGSLYLYIVHICDVFTDPSFLYFDIVNGMCSPVFTKSLKLEVLRTHLV